MEDYRSIWSLQLYLQSNAKKSFTSERMSGKDSLEYPKVKHDN